MEPPARQWLKARIVVVAAGYAIVAVVFVVFLILQNLPVRFATKFGISALSTEERFAASVILVTPFVVGLIWERLRSLKIGDIELVLDQVSTAIDIQLAAAVQSSHSSETMDLVEMMARVLAEADLKLVEVNLRSHPYWWTTRLFLLSALAQEFTEVKQLVFVKHGAMRVYIGMATPAAVRQALASNFPALEVAFGTLFHGVGGDGEEKAQLVRQIAFSWPHQRFERNGNLISEGEFRETIGPRRLAELLGEDLQADRRYWSGAIPTKSLYAKILGCKAPFVPLLIGPRLDKIVDRGLLVERLAVATVS